MVHHPTISSVNAKCPECSLVFGHVEKNGKIQCPACHTTQDLPVILTHKDDYFCVNCHASFSPNALPGSACHQCGAKPNVTPALPPRAG